MHKHHFINLGKLRRKSAARKYVNKLAWFFEVDVCAVHNVSKIADTKWARKVILEQLDEEHGVGVSRAIVDGVPWKVPPPELSHFGIMAGPSKEKW